MALYWTFVIARHLDRVEEEKKAAARLNKALTLAKKIRLRKKYA